MKKFAKPVISNKHKIFNVLLNLVLIIVFVTLLTQQLLMLGTVSSSSMDPALKKNDFIITNRLSYLKSNPKRGDIICFYQDGVLTVKRIIGLPGETVSFVDGNVFINDKYLDEPYIAANVETNSTESFDVPKGYYFVLGDNRENSDDSRYQISTYIEKDSIIGRVIYAQRGVHGITFNHYTEK